MTGKDEKLIEELEERLRWYREEASEEEFDAEEVDAICTLLQKLSPIEEPHMGQEEAFLNIMRRIEEEDGSDGDVRRDVEESVNLRVIEVDETVIKSNENGASGRNEEVEKSDRRKRRFESKKASYRAAILFIAVFGGALLSLNMVTYAREDKSLFTMILERVGLLEIVKDETAEEIVFSRNDELKTFYDSWTELDSEVKNKIIVPGYIPDGFLLYGIRYYDYSNREKIVADYYDKGNGHLLMEITLWEDKDRTYRESAIDENVYTLLSEYSDENTLYSSS